MAKETRTKMVKRTMTTQGMKMVKETKMAKGTKMVKETKMAKRTMTTQGMKMAKETKMAKGTKKMNKANRTTDTFLLTSKRSHTAMLSMIQDTPTVHQPGSTGSLKKSSINIFGVKGGIRRRS